MKSDTSGINLSIDLVVGSRQNPCMIPAPLQLWTRLFYSGTYISAAPHIDYDHHVRAAESSALFGR